MRRTLLNRIAWLQALTVVLVLGSLVGAGLYVWTLHQRVQTHLTDLEPRHARLSGLLLRKTNLETLGAQAKEQLARLTYPAAQDVTQAGNDAQQRIRTLFVDSKLDIISIQVLPTKEEGKFDRIQIDLRIEGDLTGIQDALLKLSTQSPLILVDSIAMQTIGAVKPASPQRLGGQFIFSVLRVHS